jgi:hypothetical protein
MKIYLLFLFLFIKGVSSFSQLTSSLEQIKRYAIHNRFSNFDSAKFDFDNRVQGNLHYLLPVYIALLNEAGIKKAHSDAGFYDDASQYISFTGDYSSALQFAEKSFDKLDSLVVAGIPGHVNEFKDISHIDARKYIVDKAKDQQVIMINEAHCKPLHRAFTLSLLDDLYKQGFRYLAMEAFNNYADRSLQKVNINTGHYITEPVGAELARRALSLGYTLISYEDTSRFSGSQRDAVQAANIFKVLQQDPAAKIIVHAGYGHISEKSFDNGYIPMGLAFKKLSGIDPFTIDQIEMTEGSVFEYGRIFYDNYIKKYPLQYPSIALQKNKPLSPLENTGIDLTVIHPATIYKNGRATWYSLNGLRTETGIKPTERSLFMVQAYYENEYSEKKLGLIIPADQTYIAADNGHYYLYLQKGKYKLVYRDINYQVLATKDMEIK